ncbi:MAG: hypothetical protein Q7T23_07085 [Phenylobacterium sp.]|nr:hypothetical protein [Phenylobacterium sp.]
MMLVKIRQSAVIGLATAVLLLVSCGKLEGSDQTPSPQAEPALAASAPTPTPVLAKDAAPTSDAAGEIPEIGNCHMGACSWSKTNSKRQLRGSQAGTLYELTLQGGTSSHSGNDYPAGYSASVPIQWNDEAHKVWVFCSKVLPTVMIKVGNAYQVDTLDFVNGVPNVQVSAAEIYASVCLPPGKREWTSDGFAERMGFLAIAEELPALASPGQIFDYAEK